MNNPESEVQTAIKQSEDQIQIEVESQPEEENKETIQPFQQCPKRDVWEQKYSQYFTIDIEEEKAKLLEKNRPPRKPLSPYIFFSQEKRKEIKAQKNLSAKQIMKMVSKHWQDVKDDKDITEKYEYLSLRDRELYAVLRKFWKKEKEDFPDNSNSQGQNWGMVLKSKRQRVGKNDVTSGDDKSSRVLNIENVPKEEANVDNVPAIEVKTVTDDVIIETKNCTQEFILTKQIPVEQKRQCSSQVSEKEQSQNNEKMTKFVNKRQKKTLQKSFGTLKSRPRVNSYNFNILGANLGYKIQKSVDRRNTFDNFQCGLNNDEYFGQHLQQSEFLQNTVIQIENPNHQIIQDDVQQVEIQIHESKSQQDHKVEFQTEIQNPQALQADHHNAQKKESAIDQNLFKGFDYNVVVSTSSEQRRLEENLTVPLLQLQKRNSKSDVNSFQPGYVNNYQPLNNKLSFELQAIPEQIQNYFEEDDLIAIKQSNHDQNEESQEHQIEEPNNNKGLTTEQIYSHQEFLKQQNNQIGGLSASTQPKSYAIGDTIQKQNLVNQPQINIVQYFQPTIQQQFFINPPNLGLGLQQTSINECFPSGDDQYQDDLSPLNMIMYKQKSNLIENDKIQNDENVEMIQNNMMKNYNNQLNQLYGSMHIPWNEANNNNQQNQANNMQPSNNIILNNFENNNMVENNYNEKNEIDCKGIGEQEPEHACKQSRKAPTGRPRGRPRKNKEIQ